MGNNNIPVGSLVTDGLVLARITGTGALKFGRKQLPAYTVEIVSGHERGKPSIIPMWLHRSPAANSSLITAPPSCTPPSPC